MPHPAQLLSRLSAAGSACRVAIQLRRLLRPRRRLPAAAAHRDLPVAGVRAPAPVPGARRAPGVARPPRVLRLHAGQRRPPPTAAPRVDLVALPLPRVEGLPDGAESTNSIPHDKFTLLFEAFDGVQQEGESSFSMAAYTCGCLYLCFIYGALKLKTCKIMTNS